MAESLSLSTDFIESNVTECFNGVDVTVTASELNSAKTYILTIEQFASSGESDELAVISPAQYTISGVTENEYIFNVRLQGSTFFIFNVKIFYNGLEIESATEQFSVDCNGIPDFLTPTPTATNTPTVTPTNTSTVTPTASLTPTNSQTPDVTETPTVTPSRTPPTKICIFDLNKKLEKDEVLYQTLGDAWSQAEVEAIKAFNPSGQLYIRKLGDDLIKVVELDGNNDAVVVDYLLVPTQTPTSSLPATPTITPTVTATPTTTTTYTPTLSNTPTNTISQTITHTQTITQTATITNTLTETITQTPTNTVTPTPTQTTTSTTTPTITNTLTQTSTPTNTITNTETATVTPTQTGTPTQTITNTVTNTVTPTVTPTNTSTPSYTPTNTSTATQTSSGFKTPLPTNSHTPTNSPSPSFTPTNTTTATVTPSYTPTNTTTPTNTPSFTPSNSVTPTNTPTYTATSTNTPSVTITNTVTPSDTPILLKYYIRNDSNEVYDLVPDRTNPNQIGVNLRVGSDFEVSCPGSHILSLTGTDLSVGDRYFADFEIYGYNNIGKIVVIEGKEGVELDQEFTAFINEYTFNVIIGIVDSSGSPFVVKFILNNITNPELSQENHYIFRCSS